MHRLGHVLAALALLATSCARTTPKIPAPQALDWPTARPSPIVWPEPTPARSTKPRNVPRATRGESRPAAPTDSAWVRLAHCENDRSDDSKPYNARGDRYHGWFQFTLGTWQSVGGRGDPHLKSWAEQLRRAKALQRRDGWGQWPACARKLHLL